MPGHFFPLTLPSPKFQQRGYFVAGPSVLEVFNTLLRHLRVSVDNKHSDPQRIDDEKNFQEAVINTIGKWMYMY